MSGANGHPCSAGLLLPSLHVHANHQEPRRHHEVSQAGDENPRGQMGREVGGEDGRERVDQVANAGNSQQHAEQARQEGRPDDEEDEEEREEETMERQPPLAQVAFLVGGLGLVALGAVLVVEPAVYFAHLLGLSQAVIGLTIVAVGTTLPDKAISLTGGLKARGGIVVANAVGSNIFVLTLVLGVSAIAASVVADTQTLRFDVPVMLVCALLLCLLVFRGRLHWRTGVALLALYVCYLVSQFALK